MVGLWIVGRRAIYRDLEDSKLSIKFLVDFERILTEYVKSNGKDFLSIQDLMKRSSELEMILGTDNYVHGIHVGNYLLNNAPIIPFALHEMNRLFNRIYVQDGPYNIYNTLISIFSMKIGKIEYNISILQKYESNKLKCIVRGWLMFSSIPLRIFSDFGIISDSRRKRTENSKYFRILQFVGLLATVIGPILSYLADRAEIDAAIGSALLHWR